MKKKYVLLVCINSLFAHCPLEKIVVYIPNKPWQYKANHFPFQISKKIKDLHHYTKLNTPTPKLYIPSTLNIDLILWHTGHLEGPFT